MSKLPNERHDGMVAILGDHRKRALSTEQKGVYLVMVATMWLYGGWLPAGDKELAKALGLGRHRWVTKYKPVLMMFFEERTDPVRGAILVAMEGK